MTPTTAASPRIGSRVCSGAVAAACGSWLLPLYLRLDPLSEAATRPVTAWTALAALAAAPLMRPLRAALRARRGDTTNALERPSRWALDLGYAATAAALVGFIVVSRSPAVPYMDALSLVSLQVATGAAVALLGFFLAARRRRADDALTGRTRSRGVGAAGLPGLLLSRPRRRSPWSR